MGIDQIGKRGPPVQPPADPIGRARVGETERSFEPSVTPTSTPSTQVHALETPRTALDRLRAGEVDANGYVDLKVQEATAHLGNLPERQLQAIRDVLRDRMASDPTLVELVGKATGHTPEPPGGDD
ncbi:MAG: hypothetical protein WBY94_22985 [Polyangiaceae bacterium]